MKLVIRFAVLCLLLGAGLWVQEHWHLRYINTDVTWTEYERTQLSSLKLTLDINQTHSSNANPLPDAPAAAKFGQALFFDKRLSKNGKVACASCHIPENYFAEKTSLPELAGSGATRNTPTVVGAFASLWQFWDGRKDSLWSQALGPFENPDEHNMTRQEILLQVNQHYAEDYTALFGDLPHLTSLIETPSKSEQTSIDHAFANIGKAIAAYEAQLMPSPSRFDLFVTQLLHHKTQPDDTSQPSQPKQSRYLNGMEQQGLKLFLSEEHGRCFRCHNGPYFSNFDFQVIGTEKTHKTHADLGRLRGVQLHLADPFKCSGIYSDANVDLGECNESIYTKIIGSELDGAFKVPSLRNVTLTAPYMHHGEMETLTDVLQHYSRVNPKTQQHLDIEPLGLMPHELKLIELFLHTLEGGIAAESHWLSSPH